jgi:hypothetical protein
MVGTGPVAVATRPPAVTASNHRDRTRDPRERRIRIELVHDLVRHLERPVDVHMEPIEGNIDRETRHILERLRHVKPFQGT